MRLFKVALLIVLILLTSATVHSQDFPTKPIRMIVPFAPGGASDIIARVITPKLSQILGQQIIVDNRSGASGNLGVELAAHAKPDGYTMILGNVGAMAINPGMFPTFPIKPTKHFIGISQIVDVPGALVVHPSIPVATIKDFIQYAKARPGKLNYGSAGVGSPYRLAMEHFMLQAGLKIVHVPYKGGSGASVVGVLSNEVNVGFSNLMSLLPHIKAGKLKALGVVAPKRLMSLPEVPTMVESGFTEMISGAWQGLYLPANTPHPIVIKFFDATKQAMTDPDVVKKIEEMGTEVILSNSPEQFATFMAAETKYYVNIINSVGLIQK